MDEFEHDQHRQKIFELFRTSSRGGRTIRGTADQRGMSFTLRHIPWFAAIEMGLRKQADRNRYIILELKDIPPEKRGRFDLPSTKHLCDLGQRLLATGLRHYQRTLDLAPQLKSMQAEGVPGRVIENFSLPAAIFAAIFGMAVDETEAMLRDWLINWDFFDQAQRDEIRLLQEILTSEVVMDGGIRSTVSMLLDKPFEQDAIKALLRVGIKRPRKRGSLNKAVIFFIPDVVRRYLLRGSDLED